MPLELLTKLGLPSAVVGIAIVTIAFRKTHPRTSIAAAVLAICLFLGLGVIQLQAVATYRTVFTPSDIQGLGSQGPSVIIDSVFRGTTLLKIDSVAEPAENAFVARLHALGYYRQVDGCNAAVPSPAWSTHKVFLGDTTDLGPSEYGALSITALEFRSGDTAVVTLQLPGYRQPKPARLAIHNKQFGVQTFKGAKDFIVYVREADMTGSNPWAAFNVFTSP